MGIPPEKLPEMFQLFAQGDRSLARSEGGLGIGLTIVQKLAEMHGGSVEARSDGPGTGERVRRAAARWHRGPRTARPRPGGGRPRPRARLRILVVDDNVDTALGMVRLLKLLGNDVVAVHDGPAAIEAARSFRPDFVLLDIGLPGMDGYQVAAALREDELHKDAVIIAVSGLRPGGGPPAVARPRGSTTTWSSPWTSTRSSRSWGGRIEATTAAGEERPRAP